MRVRHWSYDAISAHVLRVCAAPLFEVRQLVEARLSRLASPLLRALPEPFALFYAQVPLRPAALPYPYLGLPCPLLSLRCAALRCPAGPVKG